MNPNNLVCRTCLGIISEGKVAHNIDEENGLIRNVRNIREMIIFCVPEMDIYISVGPVVCETCLGLIINVYNFKIRCLRVENAIRAYIQTNSVMEGSVVNLNNVVKQQIIEALKQKNWPPSRIKEYIDNYLCSINKSAQARPNYGLPLNEPMFQAVSQSFTAPHMASYVSGQRPPVVNTFTPLPQPATTSNVRPSTVSNNCLPPPYQDAVRGNNFVPTVSQRATQGPPLQPQGVLTQQQIPSHQIQNPSPQIQGIQPQTPQTAPELPPTAIQGPPLQPQGVLPQQQISSHQIQNPPAQSQGIQPQAPQTAPEAPQTAPQGRGYITVSKNLMPTRPEVSFITPQIQTISRFNTPPFSKQPIVLNSYVAQNPFETSTPPVSNVEEFQTAFLQQLHLTSTVGVQDRQEAVYMKKKEPKKRTQRAKKTKSQLGIQNNISLERDIPGLNFTNPPESSENLVGQTPRILNPITGLMEESVPSQFVIKETGLRGVRRSISSKGVGDNNDEGASETDSVIILDHDTDMVPDGLMMNFEEHISILTNVNSQGIPNLTTESQSNSVIKIPEKTIFVKLPQLDKETLKRKLTADDIIDEILSKRRKLLVKLNPSLPYLNKKKRLVVNVRRDRFFTCVFCSTTTLSEKELRNHYLSSHKVCLLCNFRCDRAAVLTQHINSQHKVDLQEALKKFDHPKSELHCYLCNFIGLSDLDLRDHRLRIHVKCDTTGMYKCPYITCDEENPIAYEIAKHIEKKHDRTRHNQCPLCNYQSPVPSAVKRHLESHSLTKMKCNFCPFWSKTAFNLNMHIKKKHLESQRKSSTVSGMVFTDDLHENDDQTSCSYSDDYRITLDTFKERTQEPYKNAPINTQNNDNIEGPNLDQYELALPSLSEILCTQLFTEDLSDQENDCTIVAENYPEPPISEYPSEPSISECPSEPPIFERPSETLISNRPSELPISESNLKQTVSEYHQHKFKKPKGRPKSKQIANQGKDCSMVSKGLSASNVHKVYVNKKRKISLKDSSVDDSEDCVFVPQDITTVDLSDDDDTIQNSRKTGEEGIHGSETNTSEVIEIEDQDDNDDCFVISDNLAALGRPAQSSSENVSDMTTTKLPDDSETDTCSEISPSAKEQSLQGDVSASETDTCSEVSVSDVLSGQTSSKDNSGKVDEGGSQKSDSLHAKDKTTRDDVEPELTPREQNGGKTDISNNETIGSEKEANVATEELSGSSANLNQKMSDAQTEPEDKYAFETNENQESPEKFDQNKRSSDKELTETNKNLVELLDEHLDISGVSENLQESQKTSSVSSATDLESMTIELSDQESNDCTFVSETNAQERTDEGNARSEIVNEKSDNSKSTIVNEKDVSELSETNSNEVVPEECRDKLENVGESNETTEKTQIIDIDYDDRVVSDKENNIASSELIVNAEEAIGIPDSKPKNSENLQKNTEDGEKEGKSSNGNSEIIELEEEISNILNTDSEMIDVPSTGVTQEALDHALEAKNADRSDTISAQKHSNNQAEDNNSGTLTVNLESESDKDVITQKSGYNLERVDKNIPSTTEDHVNMSIKVDSDTVGSAQKNVMDIQGSSSGQDTCSDINKNISANLDCSELSENANNLSHGPESNQKVVERKNERSAESVELNEHNSENVDSSEAKVTKNASTISDDPTSDKKLSDSQSEEAAKSVEVNEHNSENVDSTDSEVPEQISENVSNQTGMDVEETDEQSNICSDTEKCFENSENLELLQNSKISTSDCQKGDVSENVDRVAEPENSERAVNIELDSETTKD